MALRWVGRFLASEDHPIESVEQLANATLSDSVVLNFAAFAAAQGLVLPESAIAGSDLRRMLELVIAWGRWGERGLYTMIAMRDPEVAKAVEQFPRARNLLSNRE